MDYRSHRLARATTRSCSSRSLPTAAFRASAPTVARRSSLFRSTPRPAKPVSAGPSCSAKRASSCTAAPQSTTRSWCCFDRPMAVVSGPGYPASARWLSSMTHLIYAGALGEVMAVRLNTRSMEVLGPPVMLTPRVAYGWTGSAVAISPTGTLVYRAPDGPSDARLELLDTSGVVRQLPGRFGVHGTPRFSPNGRTHCRCHRHGGCHGATHGCRRRGPVVVRCSQR